jgi:hypothetical protein
MQSFSLGDQQCNPSTYLVYACLGDTGGHVKMANETQRVLSEKAKGQSITELGLVVDDLKIPIRLFQNPRLCVY